MRLENELTDKEMNRILLASFTELRTRLKGKCGGTCPKFIAQEEFNISVTTNTESVFCKACEQNFNFLNQRSQTNDCPCFMKCNKEEIFVRLDEYIGELEEIVNI